MCMVCVCVCVCVEGAKMAYLDGFIPPVLTVFMCVYARMCMSARNVMSLSLCLCLSVCVATGDIEAAITVRATAAQVCILA